MTRTVNLEDVASEVTVGHVGSMKDEYLETGIPFLRSLNILPHRIDLNETKFISPEFHAKLKKSALKPDDVVIVRTGKPGTCAVVPKSLLVSNCSDLVIVRCGPELRPRYLAYWVNTIASEHVASHIVGAVQQHFNVGAAKKMPIRLPTLEEQDDILGILGALDDKIEANRKASACLEEMARALYRSWFVTFDPVHAKSQNRPPAHMAPTTAALFPDRFDENGLPEGWEMISVYEVARVQYGAPFKSKLFNMEKEGRPLVRIRDLKNHKAGVYTTEVHKKEYLIQPGDTVVGMDGDFTPHTWCAEPSLMNQRVCAFLPLDNHDKAFVRYAVPALLKSEEDAAVATTVIHLGKKDIDTFEVIGPGEDILRAFGERVNPMLEKLVSIGLENQTLATLRDTLLPRLMSGTLRVKAAEAEVEAVI